MTTRANRHAWLLLCLFSVLGLAFAGFTSACGDDGDPDPTPTTGAGTTPPVAASAAASSPATGASPTVAPAEGEIVVFAASSLTEAFKEAQAKFTEKNPRATVTFQFAASSALSTQINEGARADVFASADAAQMKLVEDDGNADSPSVFATNLPVVVVPKDDRKVTSFNDLSKDGVKLVLAGPDVPIGRYAREILSKASAATGGISADFSDRALANLQSNEANVRAVLTKIQVGEADAGIVYGTDAALATADVKMVEIPAAYNVIAEYPIAALSEARNRDGAKAWVEFILGTDGQAILAKHGFGTPGGR